MTASDRISGAFPSQDEAKRMLVESVPSSLPTLQKGERKEALDLARWISDKPAAHGGIISERGVVLLARALLASAAAEGKVREALEEARRYLDAVVANSGSSKRRENYAGAVRRIDAVLSKEPG